MKTPEEIKKGLKVCYGPEGCGACPYQVSVEGSFGCEEMGCEDQLMPDALAHIEKLESQIPRWIQVEERLPEKYASVIACCEDGFVDLMTHDGKHWNWNGRYEDSVTHWMPLPEPPSEKKGE